LPSARPRDAEETLKKLIRVIDDRELYEAIVALLWPRDRM